jgi:hypothetical protein
VRSSALVGSLSAVQVSVLPRVIEAQPLAMSAAVGASTSFGWPRIAMIQQVLFGLAEMLV